MKTPLLRLLTLLLAWGAAAALAGAFQFLAVLPPAGAQVTIALLAIGFSIALGRAGWLAEAVGRMGVRTILAVHVVRFVGLYFLWLHAQGRMPAEFAQRAGWGDVVAAVGALALVFWPEGAGFRRALFAWNVVGMADLFLAVGTAGWLTVTRPGSMVEITTLPLALIPLWAVPVLLSSHVVIFRRFCQQRAEVAQGSAGPDRRGMPA